MSRMERHGSNIRANQQHQAAHVAHQADRALHEQERRTSLGQMTEPAREEYDPSQNPDKYIREWTSRHNIKQMWQ